MSHLDALAKYFPTGTAEGEVSFLERAFISPTEFVSIVSIPEGSPRLLVGHKGAGKTAILEWISRVGKKRGVPTLLLRPDDLDTARCSDAADIGTLKGEMYRCLVQTLAERIGTDLKGFLRGPAVKLYEAAIKGGARDRGYVGQVMDLVTAIAQPVTSIDIKQFTTALGGLRRPENLADAVRTYLLGGKRVAFLLFDDTDQIAAPTSFAQLNRVWALILAIRKLAQDVPSLKCIISLRPEVWSRLVRNETGQRDQADHMRLLIHVLRCDLDHLKGVFDRRVWLATEDIRAPHEITQFFESDTVTLPSSSETRSWHSFIAKAARDRPRDMVQLVGRLIASAKSRKAHRISDHDAETAMRGFSSDCVVDLAAEVNGDCEAFRDVMNTFADVGFELDYADLRAHLERIPSRFRVQVRGRSLIPNDLESSILLQALLHEYGFMNPRVVDARMPKEFRHITFLDEPYFVSASRINEMQAARWDVHPAFRSHLLSLKADRSAMRRYTR